LQNPYFYSKYFFFPFSCFFPQLFWKLTLNREFFTRKRKRKKHKDRLIRQHGALVGLPFLTKKFTVIKVG
jgi:hypothetical protein